MLSARQASRAADMMTVKVVPGCMLLCLLTGVVAREQIHLVFSNHLVGTALTVHQTSFQALFVNGQTPSVLLCSKSHADHS